MRALLKQSPRRTAAWATACVLAAGTLAAVGVTGASAATGAHAARPAPGARPAAGSGPPMVSITSPAAGRIVKPGSTVTLQASPVAGAGAVTSVTFYDSTAASNNNVIGTATSSPWSVQWASVPAGSYSLTAVATKIGRAHV